MPMCKLIILSIPHEPNYTLISTDRSFVHSLCLVLGERHALIVTGLCKEKFQNPMRKKINISFYYAPFWSTNPPLGGSDFLLIKLLARKSGFIPKFIHERNIEATIHSVSSIFDSNLDLIMYLKIF